MADRIFFYILIRSWRSFGNFDRCIDSVLNQNYKKYKILFVDDNSGYSAEKKDHIKNKLKGHLVRFNKKRLFSLRNAYQLLNGLPSEKNVVVFNLDADDWLPHKFCLETVAKAYSKNKNCLLTYGECLIWDGKVLSDKPARTIVSNANLPYSKKIIKEKLYREEPFYPLHPRTWKFWLFKKIQKKDFLGPDGKWLRFAEDQAIFFPMLEMANGNFVNIKKPIYVHSFGHKYSDLNANLYKLVRDEIIIRKKPKYAPLF